MHRRRAAERTGALLMMATLVPQIRDLYERAPIKPIVTVALIALMTFIFYEDVTNPNEICIRPNVALTGWSRGLSSTGFLSFGRRRQDPVQSDVVGFLVTAFGSALTHGDTMHLYYNMASFLHKSVQLEAQWGSTKLAVWLAVIVVACNVLYIMISILSETVFGIASGCAVGWSAVIFALKVICQANSTAETAFVQGFGRVPAAAAAWMELVLISLATPNVSFVGHLAGIITGLCVVGFEKTPIARRLARLFDGRGRPEPQRARY
jgi:membrane associated rhomboid family serine protease